MTDAVWCTNWYLEEPRQTVTKNMSSTDVFGVGQAPTNKAVTPSA